MSDDFLETLKNIFASEGSEQILALDTELVNIEEKIKSHEDCLVNLQAIYRLIHTLKASVGTLGYNNIQTYFHNFETFIDKVIEERSEKNEIILKKISDNITEVVRLVNHAIAHKQDIDSLEYLSEITQIIPIDNTKNQKTILDQKPITQEKYLQIIIRPHQNILKNGLDPLIFFNDLKEHGEFIQNICETKSIPPLTQFHYDELYLTWDIILKTKSSIDQIKEVFLFASNNSEILIENISARFIEQNTEKLMADKKIGDILVERGATSIEAIQEAHEKQEKIGEILVKEGKVKKDDLSQALADQELAKKNITNTVRVDVVKLDALVNLVGELVIAESRVKTIANNVLQKEIRRDLLSHSDELARLIQDLQQKVMSVRMVPVDTIFSQFHRVIRDLATSSKKQIRLLLVGQETELDKNIIEKISNPLKHLVRNAVDHGIETAEEREKKGKPKEALVTLKSYQQEESIFIEVSDDGKGLDRDTIYQKGLEKGLIKAEDKVTDNEIYSLIFLPGFSTAKTITDISGRGVGMDVVKRSIEDELKGRIHIKTEAGKGTTFVLKLPLTLAIIEALLFKVGNEIFAIPLGSVDETMRPTPEIIQTIEEKGEFINMRGTISPLIRLHKIFNIEGVTDPCQAILFITHVNHKTYSIMVDDILGQQQIVLKSLEQNYEKIKGLSGATILGNGKIATIIDPIDVVDIYKNY